MAKLTNQDGGSELVKVLSQQDTKSSDNTKSIGLSQANARSEKKRKREKMRRSEFNQAIDLLASTINTIDPSTSDIDQTLPRCLTPDPSAKISNRVDLINRTVAVLKKLNEENEARKVLIAEATIKQSNARLPVQPKYLSDFSNCLSHTNNGSDLLMRAAALQQSSNDILQNLQLNRQDQTSTMILNERLRSSLDQNRSRVSASNIGVPHRVVGRQSTLPTLHSLGLAGLLHPSPNNLMNNIDQDVLRAYRMSQVKKPRLSTI
eukprot:CAMPEP_0194147960 /NCGR_PEP_ID=MMETSP0152-20130528/29092_1 /TAXON_ID=1049557 /ORGANISM="Thalassiothrix antarctica, Strain L6-D1" /LENGTH=262 /DNA_ID=CAMNT_0038849145 /DNA_START=119 /DNA_END=907 /DNA_ORIENTATION=+